MTLSDVRLPALIDRDGADFRMQMSHRPQPEEDVSPK
jgi:hypothetical protein